MTIELSPPSTANKPAAPQASNGARNNRGADSPQDGAGFDDILSSLDDAAPSSDASGKDAENGSTQVGSVLAPQTTLPNEATSVDPAKLLVQSQQVVQTPGESPGQVASPNVAARRPVVQALSGEKPEVATQLSNVLQATSAEAVRKSKASSDGLTQAGAAGNEVSVVDTNSQQAKAHEFKESLIQNLIQSVMRDKEVQPLQSLSPVREKMAEDRSIFKPQAADPQPAASTVGASGGFETSIPTLEGAVAVDNFVAEQVTYWISQDVQNAEMKLDGLGVEPVDVSIRLQGNEATVSFTTDEAQARSALEGAGAHLKDMLERQGMVLIGMSVGGHGADGSSQQERERRSRPGVQTGSVQAAKMPQLIPARVGSANQGKSLDLYV